MSSTPQKKVAVIAVHGISDQKPHNTAREVADIINMLPTEAGQRLDASPLNASEEHILRIPVRMAKPWGKDEDMSVPQQAAGQSKQNLLQSFLSGLTSITSSGRSLVNVRSRQGKNIPEDKLLAELESDFLNDQLEKYAPRPDREQECRHYRTIRIDQELPSVASSDAPANITTHVYEMYWGDLSRLGDSAFTLFNEFFQLLFHLATLGQHVVTSGYEEASAYYKSDSRQLKLWQLYRHCQEVAVALISLIIPLLSLHLLVLMAVTLIGRLPMTYGERAVLTLLGYMVIAGLIHLGLVASYEKRRPGAALAHVWIGGSTALVLLINLIAADKLPWSNSELYFAITSACFRTIEALYLTLAAVWSVFYLFQSVSWALGEWVKLQAKWPIKLRNRTSNVPPKDWQTRIKRCNTTARMTLAASTALYFVITTGLWSGITRLETSLQFSPQGEAWYRVSWLFEKLYQTHANLLSSQELGQALLSNSVPTTFLINLGLLLVTVITVAWGLWPSISREGNVPKEDQGSSALGRRLDRGFKQILQVSAWSLVLNMTFLMPLGYVLGYFFENESSRLKPTELCLVVLVSIPILVVVLLVSEDIRSKVRGVLDAILDVDNYLRIHPKTDNPRSRIFARYISLLRHIATQKYDGIVIVAHSQGAVISADVLRFLQREAKHSLKCESPLNVQHQTQPHGLQADPVVRDLVQGKQAIPISLFTMGAPIHQLYSHAFPHLYHWAAHYDALPKEPGDQRSIDRPNPEKLGVRQWVNAYGSGDYVGRYLWGRSTAMFNAGDPLPSSHIGCYEFCLYDGAHTHYWDGTRRQLADTIQQLVSAIVLPQTPPLPTDPPSSNLVTPSHRRAAVPVAQ